MATPAATLAILVTANTKQANAALAKTQGQLAATSKTATATSTAMKRMGTAAKYGGLLLAGGLAVGLKKSVDEAREANKVMAQTNAVIKSTGGVAKVSAKHVEELSKSISEKVGVDDEAIQSGANLLLTFKDIRNEAGKGNKIFDQTLRVATDMSAALGQDMKSSAIQLGKALNDPAVGLTALRRVGVSFNDQQSEQILKLQESGKLLQAQKKILAELTSEFKGSARAQADAGDRLTVVLNNMAEDVGQKVIPILEKMANRVSDVLSNKNLTGDEKADKLAKYFTRLFSKGLDALQGALPEIAEAGARMGGRLALALGKAFLEADIWGKLFLGAAFIRMIGGKGALSSLGMKLGSIVGRSFGLGMVTLGAALLWANRDQIIAAAEKIADHLKGLMNITPAAAKFLSEASDVQIEQALKNQEKGTDFYKQLVMEARNRGIQFRKINEDTWRDVGRNTARGADKVLSDTEGMLNKQRSGFDRTRSKLDEATRRQAGEVTRNTNNMVNAVGQGLKRLGTNTNKALKAFGAKPVNFAIVDGNKVGTSGLQRGGPINQGAPSGDSVPAMLEKGEYVLNRNAVKALGKNQLDALNFGAFSRFQVGGLAGLQPGIARLAKWAAGRYGLRVSSGLRPGDTDSFHGRGQAVDLVPPSMGATKGIFAAFKNQLAELFYDPWGGYDSGQMIGPIGGHMDHIHAAIAGSGSPVARARLKRLLLKGPKGPLRNMGQGALDKAHRAAKTFLSRQTMMGGHGNIGNISGPLQAIAKRMVVDRWGKAQWPFFNDLVMRESGWDPTAVNPSSGAAGLAQALPPSKYPAGAWPYTGKASAVKQLQWMISYIAGRYGTPSGAIAFHNANNWYQQGGSVAPSSGPFAGMMRAASAKRRLPKLREQLRRIAARIGKTDERLSIAQSLASLESSPGGSGLAGSEKTQQLALLDALYGQLSKQQGIARQGVKLSRFAGTSPAGFRDVLREVEGLTGKGGRLFDTDLARKELMGTPLAGAGGISIDQLLQIADAARLGLFQSGGVATPSTPPPSPVHESQTNIYFADGMDWLRKFIRVEHGRKDRRTELMRRAGVLR